MQLLKELQEINRKGKLERKNSAKKKKEELQKSKQLRIEEYAQKIIAGIPGDARAVAKDKNYLQVLKVDYVAALGYSEYNPKTGKLRGASKIIFDYCKKEGLNPKIDSIVGDDGTGGDMIIGYDLFISW